MPLELTRSERDLLLNIEVLAPDTAKKLQSAKLQGNVYRVECGAEAVNALIGGLDEEAGRTDETYLARAYEELRRKLERTIQPAR